MKNLITAVATTLALAATSAAAEPMPKELTAEWCHLGDGIYRAAKRFCAKERDVIFAIQPIGFWVQIKGHKAPYLCLPRQVETLLTDGAWRVTAHCGLSDDSGPVNERTFTFTLIPDNRMSVSLGD